MDTVWEVTMIQNVDLRSERKLLKVFRLKSVTTKVKVFTSIQREKGLTGYCFKYIDLPMCPQTNK